MEAHEISDAFEKELKNLEGLAVVRKSLTNSNTLANIDNALSETIENLSMLELKQSREQTIEDLVRLSGVRSKLASFGFETLSIDTAIQRKVESLTGPQSTTPSSGENNVAGTVSGTTTTESKIVLGKPEVSMNWQIPLHWIKTCDGNTSPHPLNIHYDSAAEMLSFAEARLPHYLCHVLVPLSNVRYFIWTPDNLSARLVYMVAEGLNEVVDMFFTVMRDVEFLREKLQSLRPEIAIMYATSGFRNW